jgi:hypothetical protein
MIKSKRLSWVCNLARIQEGMCSFKILTDSSAAKGRLGRLRGRWEEKMKRDPNYICVSMRK